MIELIDQSDPNAPVYRCDNCGRSFKQPSSALLDLHMPSQFYTPSTRDQARKAGIPPCDPVAVKSAPPVTAAEPESEAAKEVKVKK